MRQAIIDDVVIVSEQEASAAAEPCCGAPASTSGPPAAPMRRSSTTSPTTPVSGRKPSVLYLCADWRTSHADTVYNSTWVAETHDVAPDPSRATAATR